MTTSDRHDAPGLDRPATRPVVAGEMGTGVTVAGMDVDHDQLDALVGALSGRGRDVGALHLDKDGNLPAGVAEKMLAREQSRRNRQSDTEMLVGDQGGMRRVLAGFTGIPASIDEPIPRQKSRVENTAEVVKSITESNVGAPGAKSKGKAHAAVAGATDKVQAVFAPDPKRLIGMGADFFTKDKHGDRHTGSKATKFGLYAVWSLVPFPWNIVVFIAGYFIISIVLTLIGIVMGLMMSMGDPPSPTDAVSSWIKPPWQWSIFTSDEEQAEAEEAAEHRAEAAEEMRAELDMEGVDIATCLAPYGDTVMTTPPRFIGAEAPPQPTPPTAPERPGSDASREDVERYNAAVREYNAAVTRYGEDLETYRDTAHLYSTDAPVMDQDAPVLSDGELTDAATGVAEQLPVDADPLLAQAYLMTAWAGGTSGWEHFTAVVRSEVPGGLNGVTAGNMAAVVAVFFEPGSDSLAYQVPAGVSLHTLQRRGQFNDSAEPVGLTEFLACTTGTG